MTTIYQLKERFYFELKDMYPKQEIESFFYLSATTYFKKTRMELALEKRVLSSEDITFFETVIKELKRQKPIQYILGKTEFYGLSFVVNKNTLIPRPETEELVEWVLQSAKTMEFPKILDIGTGSGCIAVSLAKNLPKAIISAIDISEKALEIAKVNAKNNGVTILFQQQDVFEIPFSVEKYDIIVSNPPYVRDLEKQEINKNVLSYEPHSALFVPNDNPLIFYEKITDFAKNSLSEKGMLFFEINQYLGAETVEMIRQKGFSKVELRKDFYGNDRMILACF
ncbi:MAG: peptide chain release factor N(5)-glutamine methyltransferase [Flavobacteriaceae bacterium]|nr:peptide chain release factor N(5)-glutamine methyltransferase [Flavobacteriaceae bacterium]